MDKPEIDVALDPRMIGGKLTAVIIVSIAQGQFSVQPTDGLYNAVSPSPYSQPYHSPEPET